MNRGHARLIRSIAPPTSTRRHPSSPAASAELIAAGQLHSTVTHQASFEDVPQALERLASRDAVGKSVVLVSD